MVLSGDTVRSGPAATELQKRLARRRPRRPSCAWCRPTASPPSPHSAAGTSPCSVQQPDYAGQPRGALPAARPPLAGDAGGRGSPPVGRLVQPSCSAGWPRTRPTAVAQRELALSRTLGARRLLRRRAPAGHGADHRPERRPDPAARAARQRRPGQCRTRGDASWRVALADACLVIECRCRRRAAACRGRRRERRGRGRESSSGWRQRHPRQSGGRRADGGVRTRRDRAPRARLVLVRQRTRDASVVRLRRRGARTPGTARAAATRPGRTRATPRPRRRPSRTRPTSPTCGSGATRRTARRSSRRRSPSSGRSSSGAGGLRAAGQAPAVAGSPAVSPWAACSAAPSPGAAVGVARRPAAIVSEGGWRPRGRGHRAPTSAHGSRGRTRGPASSRRGRPRPAR